MNINNEIFSSYFLCKLKSYLIGKGKVGKKCDYELVQYQTETEYKEQAVKILTEKHRGRHITDYKYSKPPDLRKGHSLLLNIILNYKDLRPKVDALELTEFESTSKSSGYFPILFVCRNKIKREDKLLLGLIAYVIKNIQKKEA